MSLQGLFNKHGYNFDDVNKMATPGLLKTKVFWKRGYDVIIYVHDVTSKMLSRDSVYNVFLALVFLWEKLS